MDKEMKERQIAGHRRSQVVECTSYCFLTRCNVRGAVLGNSIHWEAEGEASADADGEGLGSVAEG